MTDNEILWAAEFNPKVRTYWLLSGALILLATVVGIPLIPIWFVVGNYFTERYLRRMSCVLTPRTLRVAKGLFVRVEKTVPLEKITDVGVVHGPIMRYLDLQALSVETAGQSSQGALIKLIGVVETEKFREAVLEQRDKVSQLGKEQEHLDTLSPSAASETLLAEIRDTLKRIEVGLSGRERA